MPPPGLDPDDPWRRPDPGDAAPNGETVRGPEDVASGGASGYHGPPPTTAPAPGWRPPVHLQPTPPRQLPPQDMSGLDTQEQRAQQVTLAVGAVAGTVLVVLACLLGARLLF
nr:hypothetical protein [Micromonospora sp. HNM0581]